MHPRHAAQLSPFSVAVLAGAALGLAACGGGGERRDAGAQADAEPFWHVSEPGRAVEFADAEPGADREIGPGVGPDADAFRFPGDPAPARGASAAAPPAEPEPWRLLVARVQPNRDPAQVRDNLAEILSAEGFRRDRIGLTTREGEPVVVYGAYRGPDDKDATADLSKLKATRYNGVPLFRNAVLLPPPLQAVAGSNPAWDLGRVRALGGFGEDDKLLTLQVGLYGRADTRTPTPRELAVFREAAEEAVATLRAGGEDAFYYHGPISSTITVGVFGPRDHDGTVFPPLESPRLRETRERNPHNLLNGAGISEVSERGRRLQRSRLVNVP